MGYGNGNNRDNEKTDAGVSFPGLTRESSEDRPCFNPTYWMHAGAGMTAGGGILTLPMAPERGPTTGVEAMTDPIATYRLQLRPEFGFAEAARIVPYLADLGISHIYASPIFRARPGSPHGYDGVDPNALNPELGSREDWQALVRRRQATGMGWIQDIVPNHMAFYGDNGLLVDILEHGPASRYRDYFDIDWHHPSEDLEGRIMAPFLGRRYRDCLQNGDIRIVYSAEGFAAVVYGEMRFPLGLESYLQILDPPGAFPGKPLTDDHPEVQRWDDALDALESLDLLEDAGLRCKAARAVKEALWDLHVHNAAVRHHVSACLERLNGEPGNLESLHALDRLLSQQRFRLCWWKNAAEEINYRRFFDINDLIALRQEDPAVFDHTHGLLARMTAAGRIDGVRVDHVDGLADPGAYLQRLRALLGHKALILVEKILAPEEDLPADWPVQGTTGYDFAHWLNALFVQRENEARFTSAYQNFTGYAARFEVVVHGAKLEMLGTRLAGDLANLARRVQSLAAATAFAGHMTLKGLTEALMGVMADLPVYRTYRDAEPIRPADRQVLESAVSRAIDSRPHLRTEIRFIRDLLLEDHPDRASDRTQDLAGEHRRVLQAFQQLSAALMAKGCEDTAFYRYHRLVSLNDVGGDPGDFGRPAADFHDFIARRAVHWPLAMNSTATHDSKRGEDIRARLNVLSEIPDEWERRIGRWHALTRAHRAKIGPEAVPDRKAAYLLFQTLIGAWNPQDRSLRTFVKRIQDYMVKAMREAGRATSWTAPREDYEKALTGFVAAILEPRRDNAFLADFIPFQRKVAFYGRFNALSQCLIKIAAPGIPDFYQGTECWQLALVDPDNRRPVAYAERKGRLQAFRRHADALRLAAELVENAGDGRIKLFLMARALAARRHSRGLFVEGGYQALETGGALGRHVIAFAREARGQWALVVAPRFLTSLVRENQAPLKQTVWQDTVVRLPSGAPRTWHNAFTRQKTGGQAQIAVGDALAHFPAALMTSEEIP